MDARCRSGGRRGPCRRPSGERSRDRTCRFPGCGQHRFLHAHHIQHWAHGGGTDLSNLIQLCTHHHRLVHEGGYSVERRRGGAVRFRRPDGQAVPCVPSAPHGEAAALTRLHRAAGVAVDDVTCVPCVHSERMQLHWIVDGLAEADPRLKALDPPPRVMEPRPNALAPPPRPAPRALEPSPRALAPPPRALEPPPRALEPPPTSVREADTDTRDPLATAA
jgi:hypothetical protein